jgi:hypothetical protein
MSSNEYIETLTIQEVFDYTEYVIPIYQRNYAWGEAQITQLIDDIVSSMNSKTDNYYLGSLVVFKREVNNQFIYETIDGQQRLTTLNLLFSVIKNEFSEVSISAEMKGNLKFDSRDISSKTLTALYNYGLAPTTLRQNASMVQAYHIIKKKLTEQKNQLQEFIEYLSSNVKILRIEVPEKTDLNHYFEVMNNRGEQLEKQEILKAQFLDVLTVKQDNSDNLTEESIMDRKTFHLLWEACSQMDRYLQYCYSKENRIKVFGNEWDYIPTTFQELKERTFLNNQQEVASEIRTLEEILELNKVNPPSELLLDESGQAQFTPVVTFSNFLLHVLKVWTKKDVALDDKKLIVEFKHHILGDHIFDSDKPRKIELVREFAHALFKSKYLFDQYIVKKAYRNNEDKWSLLRLKKQHSVDIGYYPGTFGDGIEEGGSAENKNLIMLLSMFHVSFPQTTYKHWLTGALNYLFDQKDTIIPSNYRLYLESMSDAFFFDRLKRTALKYEEIIFKNNCEPQNTELLNSDIDENLNIGTQVQNFIFNRLDYKLWHRFDDYLAEIEDIDDKYANIQLNQFEFAFRSSVEHYSPQHPMHGKHAIDGIDQFGNLCLISRSKNSELSNYTPNRKKEHYYDQSTVESLKQRLMMCYKEWNETAIEDHQDRMISLLKQNFNGH